MAFIACSKSDPDNALACHYAASHRDPRRNPGETLSDAVSRADLAFRAAAAHHCALGCHFLAVYWLLTPTERSTYTGRPGIRDQLQRPFKLCETLEAAVVPLQGAPR